MEIPRDELDLVDAATEYIARHAPAGLGDAWEEEGGDDSWGDGIDDDVAAVPRHSQVQMAACEFEMVDVASDPVPGGSEPAVKVAAASIKTAAALVTELTTAELPRISPDAFKQGQAVLHPEYGPGKIMALSGTGKNRRATIQFAAAGEKKIILAHSAVRPAR